MIRPWSRKFGQNYANHLRRRRAQPGDTWFLDEVFLKITGTTDDLWGAVDQHGNVRDILGQSRRTTAAAQNFLAQGAPQLLKGCQYVPRGLIREKLGSYDAAKHAVMPQVAHRRHRRLNNRAANAQQPTRQRERGSPAGVCGLHVSRPCPTLPLRLRSDP